MNKLTIANYWVGTEKRGEIRGAAWTLANDTDILIHIIDSDGTKHAYSINPDQFGSDEVDAFAEEHFPGASWEAKDRADIYMPDGVTVAADWHEAGTQELLKGE